jgi:Zn-dependent protease
MLGNYTLQQLVIIIVSILISLSFHEAMHAYVGFKLGDDTALDEGRVSLNPLRHIDPFSTLLLPVITLIAFGAPILAAKPVPFNPARVKYEEYGAAMIAAAGPLTNFVLAAITATAIKLINPTGLLQQILDIFLTLNVGLFVFNLIPIPPLDGSRVLYAFAPEPLQDLMRQIEPFGLIIVFGLVIIGGLGHLILFLNNSVLNFLT